MGPAAAPLRRPTIYLRCNLCGQRLELSRLILNSPCSTHANRQERNCKIRSDGASNLNLRSPLEVQFSNEALQLRSLALELMPPRGSVHRRRCYVRFVQKMKAGEKRVDPSIRAFLMTQISELAACSLIDFAIFQVCHFALQSPISKELNHSQAPPANCIPCKMVRQSLFVS